MKILAVLTVVLFLLFFPYLLGYRWTYLVSSSMTPSIYPYDLVLVEKAKDVKVGDIVVFRLENETICHRVISINGSMVTTKGDSAGSTVETFPIFFIHYKVVQVGNSIVKIPIGELLFRG